MLEPGDQFNFLTVLTTQRISGKYSCVQVRCVCGVEKRLRAASVRSGATQSCGCQRSVSIGNTHRRHGMDGTPIYRTWATMLSRCTNPNATGYARYGGRGIVVCDSWKTFENFHTDMGDRPDGHTLERRENNQGYSKDNCMWATRKAQARNRRNTIFVEVDGVRVSLAEAAERAGLTYACVLQRFNRGWPIQKALANRSST